MQLCSTSNRSPGIQTLIEGLKVLMALGGMLSAMTYPSHAASPMYQVGDNGHYLINAKGEPFFWQGDTEWELFYLLTAEDAKELLRARKKQGFTVVQAMCDGLFPSWVDRDKLPPLDKLMPWLNDDPLTPNEAFFNRMDAIVAAAVENHMLLLIGVYHAEDVQTKRITLANVGEWTRWLAHRYKDVPNIIWTMYSSLESSSFPMVRAALKGLSEGDEGSHLVTLHPEGVSGSSSLVQAELSFNTYQSLNSGRLNYEFAQADYARQPVKPVVNGEARYEGDEGITAFDVRRSAWWSFMGGAAFSYGHIENWKSPSSWREWVDAPGAKQVEVFGKLLRSLTWWKLISDQSILNSNGEYASARSDDGAWILAYLPTNLSVTLKLDAVTAKQALVSWINPVTGDKIKIGLYPTDARPRLTPPADWEDAVLLAEKEGD